MLQEKDNHVNVIRETHRNLRRKLADCNDFDKVWKQHCSDDRLLYEYSSAMKQLATDVWDGGCDGRDRTVWCKDVSLEYFDGGGLLQHLRKDERRKEHYNKEKSNFICNSSDKKIIPLKEDVKEDGKMSAVGSDEIKLLDVGSCFNPFSSLTQFETTAIDLSPANEGVYHCDFLSVEIDVSQALDFNIKNTDDSNSVKSLTKLPSDYFQVVVFSLLLSYIPCPHSRWLMCEKAHRVLRTNGLLLIVTPDSSHQNRHAALMKSWKLAIERIGFQRIKYEKDKHFHLIAFRKVPGDFIWDKRKLQNDEQRVSVLNIPQDFTDKISTSSSKSSKTSI